MPHESTVMQALKTDTANILKVAVPAPLYTLFDYLPPKVGAQMCQPGCRVRIPFGRKQLVGVIVDIKAHSSLDKSRLRHAVECLDDEALLPADVLKLLKWSAAYYQHPVGDVLSAALPVLLRQGHDAVLGAETVWQSNGHAEAESLLHRAPKQKALYQFIDSQSQHVSATDLKARDEKWRDSVRALVKKKLVVESQKSTFPKKQEATDAPPELNAEQKNIVSSILSTLDQNQAHLLHGVTGSGKTEVYLQLSDAIIKNGKQVLILAPEISLTPQLTHWFQRRLGGQVVCLHSGLNDRQRQQAWLLSRFGHANVVIGTRSAVFTPMPNIGLIIIDEEHDTSFKQQDGFRYHARDLALVRARDAGIPVVLGSATPSLESLHNASRGLFVLHRLSRQARNSHKTSINLLDICRRPLLDGLSDLLTSKIRAHLANDGQVLLFLNRRGFAPVMMCHDCGWSTECERCDAHMTYHEKKQRLRCHHCDREQAAPTSCPGCDSQSLIMLGAGTERIEQALSRLFPEEKVLRIDRDTTRRKGELNDKLELARSGEARLLVGTQMLSKGHDFPNLTLVGILDTDQGLFSADFRATEHMAQLIIQVAGRAGRAHKPGEVFIQTHHPEHHLLQLLLNQGYEGFSRAALEERQQACFPPYTNMALIRSESMHADSSFAFLTEASNHLKSIKYDGQDITVFGPLSAPMEKRAGRYRAQLMLHSSHRGTLQSLLRQWIPELSRLKSASRVRWSVDVDPVDTY